MAKKNIVEFKNNTNKNNIPEEQSDAMFMDHLFESLFHTIEAITELVYNIDKDVQDEYEDIQEFRVNFIHDIADVYDGKEE